MTVLTEKGSLMRTVRRELADSLALTGHTNAKITARYKGGMQNGLFEPAMQTLKAPLAPKRSYMLIASHP